MLAGTYRCWTPAPGCTVTPREGGDGARGAGANVWACGPRLRRRSARGAFVRLPGSSAGAASAGGLGAATAAGGGGAGAAGAGTAAAAGSGAAGVGARVGAGSAGAASATAAPGPSDAVIPVSETPRTSASKWTEYGP